MTDLVRTALEGGVLSITLNRADKKNALNKAMYAAVVQAMLKAEEDPAIRVVLFQAEGDFFTSGNDIADFTEIAMGKVEPRDAAASPFLLALASATKPLVAAVQGHAVGVGTTMLLHCDMVVAADDAKLSVPFVNLALVPEAASSMLLPARIGYARAYKLFALGEPLFGKDAAALGVVTEALPAVQVRARALELAKALATRPAGALKLTKQLMRDPGVIKSVMEREGAMFKDRLRSPEALEAFRAFAERRAPDFTKVA
ncbi:MAG: enoyl-CoA hydratase [Xanthobacteraceae bacterium]|nr:enoyl-CoA hydratase [Xanthobacteraceae bacterium]QYK45951.1 MAG: enoyl-CoA hydratase [Xanthobacteraceae bacterium]